MDKYIGGHIGITRDNGQYNGNYFIVYRGYIRIMEKKTVTTI